MKRRLILIPFILICMLTSCLSTTQMAEQALAEASYIEAIELLLEALQENPANPEALLMLKNSWNQANSQWRASIENLKSSESPEEMERVLKFYDDLITIHTLVSHAGGWNLDPDPDTIANEALENRNQIAKEYMNKGSSRLYTETREGAQEAAPLFLKAFNLNPELKETFYYLYERAMKQATVRVFIFTGPDTNFRLNGIRIIPHIEDLLDRIEFVEAVRVPDRYAAPVDDDHRAKDFARGHGADLMLHIEPDTIYSASVKNESQPLTTVPWIREITYLEAIGSSNLRLVLIDLSDDSVISDTKITVDNLNTSAIQLSGISGTRKENIQLTDMSAPRQLVVQTVPSGMDSMTLVNNLNKTKGIDLPDWGFQTGAEPLVTEPLDMDRYKTLEDLEAFSRIPDHTFLLFDVLEFNQYGDGSLSYQYVYGTYMGEGVPGRLATSSYERELYSQLKEKLNSPQIKNEFTERFVKSFYEIIIGNEVVKAVADLF